VSVGKRRRIPLGEGPCGVVHRVRLARRLLEALVRGNCHVVYGKTMNHPYVLAITGASGALFASRLLQVLRAFGHNVVLTISPSGESVFQQELGVRLGSAGASPERLSLESLVTYPPEPPPPLL